MNKKIKTTLIIILTGMMFSCGYKPLNQKNVNLIYFQDINIDGERRSAYDLKNNMLLLSDSASKNKYNAEIKIKEEISNKIKNKKNQTTRYNLSMSVNLELINVSNNEKIQKVFFRNEDYYVASIHSETIFNRKKATKNIIRQITDDINTFITLKMRNK
tara:strand:- start:188 stop:664 length:477 start_codon:yes stop_codon:yes gene_type:complete